jgi:hypothetical protein
MSDAIRADNTGDRLIARVVPGTTPDALARATVASRLPAIWWIA